MCNLRVRAEGAYIRRILFTYLKRNLSRRHVTAAAAVLTITYIMYLYTYKECKTNIIVFHRLPRSVFRYFVCVVLVRKTHEMISCIWCNKSPDMLISPSFSL